MSTTTDVNGETISRASITKYLGAHLDSALNLKKHIKTKCKAAMFNLQWICAARTSLTRSASNKLMLSLVISHLDYTSTLLGGLPTCSIEQLQRVQNIAAKIVLGKGRYDSSTRCLAELHWLPIQQRIEFKIIQDHPSAQIATWTGTIVLCGSTHWEGSQKRRTMVK